MRHLLLLVCVMLMVMDISTANDDQNWAGASGYFAWSKSDNEIDTMLAAMKKADMKVLRIFLTQISSNVKGGHNEAVSDVEPQVGIYNDSILLKVDNLLTKCKTYEIKLTIAIHDRYMLGCWGKDAYYYKYKYPPSSNCGLYPSENDCSAFYSNSDTISFFEKRIEHVLSHYHIGFGKKWSQLDDVIFSFEPQNEPQSYLPKTSPMNSTWLCHMTSYIKSLLPVESSIVTTDGGFGPAVNPLFSTNSKCPHLDVMGVHFYGSATGLSDELPALVKIAHSGQKRIFLQEFGSYGNKKANHTNDQIKVALQNDMPWMYWELSKPGSEDQLEVWISDNTWTQVLSPQGKNTSKQQINQKWPEIWGSK